MASRYSRSKIPLLSQPHWESSGRIPSTFAPDVVKYRWKPTWHAPATGINLISHLGRSAPCGDAKHQLAACRRFSCSHTSNRL